MCENREVPWSPAVSMDASSGMVRGVVDQRWVGREGNASGGNPLMHDREKSDRLVLPANSPNNPGDRGRRWGGKGTGQGKHGQ